MKVDGRRVPRAAHVSQPGDIGTIAGVLPLTLGSSYPFWSTCRSAGNRRRVTRRCSMRGHALATSRRSKPSSRRSELRDAR